MADESIHIFYLIPSPALPPEPPLCHRASLRLAPGQSAGFEVGFHPEQPLSARARIEVLVQDNQYNRIMVNLTGEAYRDIITLDNLRRTAPEDGDLEEGRRRGWGGGDEGEVRGGEGVEGIRGD